MSILADQNINNLNAPVAAAEGGVPAKWVQNLGRNSSQDREGIPGGWGGYKYSPPGLSESILGDKWRVGPQGKMLTGGVGEYEYGPKEYARLSSSDSAKGEYCSLLTSFAFMIGKGGEWAASDDDDDGEEEAKPPSAAARMKQTFASGSQMRSLWNAETGINGTPTSSGGAFTGYQADHIYGISNWFKGDEVSGVLRREGTTAELEDAEEGGRNARLSAGDSQIEAYTKGKKYRAKIAARGFGGGTTETVTPLVNIDTGIRNVPGMMGPKS